MKLRQRHRPQESKKELILISSSSFIIGERRIDPESNLQSQAMKLAIALNRSNQSELARARIRNSDLRKRMKFRCLKGFIKTMSIYRQRESTSQRLGRIMKI